MLDAVDAGADGGEDAVPALGVRGDLPAAAVRLLDDGLHLLGGEVVVPGQVPLAAVAAGRADLDEVRAAADRRPDGHPAVVGPVHDRAGAREGAPGDVHRDAVPVGVPAGLRQDRPGGDDPRADDLALLHRPAQRRTAHAAAVARRREAAAQHPAGVRRAAQRVQRQVGPGVPVRPVPHEVGVRLDHPGQQRALPRARRPACPRGGAPRRAARRRRCGRPRRGRPRRTTTGGGPCRRRPRMRRTRLSASAQPAASEPQAPKDRAASGSNGRASAAADGSEPAPAQDLVCETRMAGVRLSVVISRL